MGMGMSISMDMGMLTALQGSGKALPLTSVVLSR